MIEKARALSSDFIGVYIRTYEDVTFVPRSIDDETGETLHKCLGTDVHRVLTSDTQLIGTMMMGNDHGFIVNDGLNPAELRRISGDRCVSVLKDKLNAVGNDIIANDHSAIVHKGFSKSSMKKIEDCLDVEVIRTTIGGIRTVGSVAVITPKGMLVTPTVSEEELEFLSGFFKIQVKPGTANFGSIFVGSSMVANSHGIVVGDSTTPIEIGRIDDVLS